MKLIGRCGNRRYVFCVQTTDGTEDSLDGFNGDYPEKVVSLKLDRMTQL